MKPGDLRLGNYIQDRQYRLCIVKELTEETINAPVIDWPVTGLPHRPIELTEEWLFKFGFEKSYGEFTKTDFDFRICGNEVFTNSEFNPTKICKLEYVHQLQNLTFALTGQGLTIKNEA